MTPTPTDALVARLEAASGRSRVLDFEIRIACVGDAIWPARDNAGRITNANSRMSDYLRLYRDVIDSDDQDFDFPRYTASRDAAAKLIPEDFSCETTESAAPASAPELKFTRCRLWDWRRGPLMIDPANEWAAEGNRPLPINIVIASLKARARTEQSK